jgi:Xaa-Pro aminopeptidase
MMGERDTGDVGQSVEAVAKAIERRRGAVAAAWDGFDGVVLIAAGDPIPVPGRADRTYPFMAHSEYFYLTDRQRPGGTLAYDPRTGWIDFVRVPTADDRLWSGAVDEEVGTPASELTAWLEKQHGRRVARLGSPLAGLPADSGAAGELRTRLDRVRRVKDDIELIRMRVAVQATSAGFAAASRLLSTGLSERRLQIEMEAAFFRHGADAVAYDSIVASGPNAAVLHHLPTDRILADGELVLIDAAGEYRCYDCDVTRTYPVSGRLRPEQADVHGLVSHVQRLAIDRCRAGAEYRDIHLAAARDIAQGLVDLGLLRGAADDLVEQGTCALFFPHGIGHMVGLGVRDAGGYLPGRARSDAPALRFLRIDLPLEPGHVVTIEPGIYFLDHLLDEPDVRRRHGDRVIWSRVDRLRGFGGVRIEDNLLILDRGNEVLTRAIPQQ